MSSSSSVCSERSSTDDPRVGGRAANGRSRPGCASSSATWCASGGGSWQPCADGRIARTSPLSPARRLLSTHRRGAGYSGACVPARDWLPLRCDERGQPLRRTRSYHRSHSASCRAPALPARAARRSHAGWRHSVACAESVGGAAPGRAARHDTEASPDLRPWPAAGVTAATSRTSQQYRSGSAPRSPGLWSYADTPGTDGWPRLEAGVLGRREAGPAGRSRRPATGEGSPLPPIERGMGVTQPALQRPAPLTARSVPG
jgi:hypothetical protein